MKLLERIFNQDDKPIIVGSALAFERPAWLVTCVTKRGENFGQVFNETRYDVVACTEEEALKSVRSYVRRAEPDGSIESLHATRL